MSTRAMLFLFVSCAVQVVTATCPPRPGTRYSWDTTKQKCRRDTNGDGVFRHFAETDCCPFKCDESFSYRFDAEKNQCIAISEEGELPLLEREPDKAHVKVVYRDFVASHPDFQSFCCGLELGMVKSELGSDGKPQFKGGRLMSTKANFDQWFRDVEGVNKRMNGTLTLNKFWDGTFVYDTASFFPLDNKGFKDIAQACDGSTHNFYFTMELHTDFVYKGGEKFTFRGDDDVWVYVNGILRIDIGGVHGPISRTMDLDQMGLIQGETQQMSMFFAERRVCGSNFRIQNTIEFNPFATADCCSGKCDAENSYEWDARIPGCVESATKGECAAYNSQRCLNEFSHAHKLNNMKPFYEQCRTEGVSPLRLECALCCHSRIVSGSCCPEGCSEMKTYQWDSEISRCLTDSNNSGSFDLFAPSACCVREHDAAYTATKRFYSDEHCTNETGFVEQTMDNKTGCIAERRYQDGIGDNHTYYSRYHCGSDGRRYLITYTKDNGCTWDPFSQDGIFLALYCVKNFMYEKCDVSVDISSDWDNRSKATCFASNDPRGNRGWFHTFKGERYDKFLPKAFTCHENNTWVDPDWHRRQIDAANGKFHLLDRMFCLTLMVTLLFSF